MISYLPIGVKSITEVPFLAAVYSSSTVEYSVGTVKPFQVYQWFVREAKLVREWNGVFLSAEYLKSIAIYKSPKTTFAAFFPEIPCIPPPGCVPAPHMYKPSK